MCLNNRHWPTQMYLYQVDTAHIFLPTPDRPVSFATPQDVCFSRRQPSEAAYRRASYSTLIQIRPFVLHDDYIQLSARPGLWSLGRLQTLCLPRTILYGFVSGGMDCCHSSDSRARGRVRRDNSSNLARHPPDQVYRLDSYCIASGSSATARCFLQDAWVT